VGQTISLWSAVLIAENNQRQKRKNEPIEFVRQKRPRSPHGRIITDPKNFASRSKSAAYLTYTHD
jgi:hypothetical protein